jgi:aerobic carbon-monoxide dehydrogenase large subunit
MTAETQAPRFFGARVKRVEDPRLLIGGGRFVDDIDRIGMLHARFVRSVEARAKITGIDVSEAEEMPGVVKVFTGRDFSGKEVRCVSAYDGFQASGYPALAEHDVKFNGEAVAMVVAEDPYQAEDAADRVIVDYDPLPPVVDAEKALLDDSPLVHDHWTSNAFVERRYESPGFSDAKKTANHSVSGRFVMARHSGIPLETRAAIGDYDKGSRMLTLWTTTQIPYLIRTGLADAIGFPENRIRVISPDVGGGFGVKAQLYPEELDCSLASIDLGRPVKWVEDRREHLLTAHHAREHTHEATLYFDDDGIVDALEAKIIVNMGPYSVFPWTATMDTGMAMGILPGPYKIKHYSVLGYPVATNKAPYGAYRGVSRPAACFTIERLMDQVARHLGLDPAEVRRRNYVTSDDYPYKSAGGLEYDSGSMVESQELLLEQLDYEGLRRWQQEERDRGRLIGIGLGAYTEQTAHATKEFVQRGVPIIFGYETSTLRLDPSGKLVINSSIHNHGQGLETTLAQMAADALGIDIADVRVEYGDTSQAAYGSGTFASRSAVLAGGAARRASEQLRDQLARVAAHNLEASPADIEFDSGRVFVAGSPDRGYDFAELCRIVYHRPELVPEGQPPILEATVAYDAPPGTGTFTNATQLAVVEVDPGTGGIEILRYAIVEDCGPMINPMVVEGQIFGGIAQGIGSAIYEEFVYDEEGHLLTTTFMDYMMPGTTEVPPMEVFHLETPSPFTVGGIKGMGEGGAIAPGAVIAGAVEDALAPLGPVTVNQIPLTPQRVRQYVDSAREAASRQ